MDAGERHQADSAEGVTERLETGRLDPAANLQTVLERRVMQHRQPLCQTRDRSADQVSLGRMQVTTGGIDP